MKKFTLILGMCFALCANARAEVYHGIDIDAVYESSDWSNKDKIKEIIDDYSLLLQYYQRLSQCSFVDDRTICLNALAEDIIRQFYGGDKNKNITDYHNYIEATSTAYGIVYCLNKYRTPSGTMCNQENSMHTNEVTEQYIEELLHSVKLSEYSFIADYKD